MFFLGAGFMLLETKSVVHMTLLFGSTWLVNSIVFFAILVDDSRPATCSCGLSSRRLSGRTTSLLAAR